MANLMTMLAWDVGGTEGLPPHTLSSPFLRGVGLSFLFAGPLILLVFSTFLVGGNVQTLVCQSWESGELYEVGGGRCEQRKRVRRKWGPEKARGRTGQCVGGESDRDGPTKTENHQQVSHGRESP